MARYRRKRRGTWLPLLGTYPNEGDTQEASANTYLQVEVPLDGSAIPGVVPLTYDVPQEAPDLSASADTLSEIVGSEYIVKRIVGQCFAHNASSVNSAALSSIAPAVQLTAAFFVARAGAQNELLGADAPISWSSDVGNDVENYSPEHPATVREPWMWKRTWILGNERLKGFLAAAGVAALGWSSYPSSTAAYGSIKDGPQIDVKSRRRVGQDDRLYFIVSARTLPFNQGFASHSFVDVALCVRIFGSLVKARNKSTF